MKSKPVSNPDAIRASAAGWILTDVIDEVIRMHQEIVDPWELDEDKPDFTREVEMLVDSVVFRVLMTAESAEEATLSVWQLLNREEGTKERPMHVSPDWKSKTDPASPLMSGPGEGHTTGIFPPWASGIEGRQFDKAVAEEMETVADAVVEQAITKALDREFGG